MPLNKRGFALKALVAEHGVEQVCTILQEAMALPKDNKDRLRPRDFSVRELAEAFMGHDWVRRLDPGAESGGLLMEEGGAGVDSTAFANITGQIVYATLIEAYQAPQFVAENFVKIVPTQFYDGEKIAGITAPRGNTPTVGEGMPYPELGISEDYRETPATTKQGFIVSLTKETIYKDRTGLILDRAALGGERIGYDREKRMLAAVMGLTNNYKWKGTTYNTYLTSGNWINDAGSVDIQDYTSIEAVQVQLADIANPDQPDSTEPLPVMLDSILCMPFKDYTFRRILNASQVWVKTQSLAFNAITGNPVTGFNHFSSAIAYQLLQSLGGISAANAKYYWFACQADRAFEYRQNWPITVVQAPPNADADFERDVVARWKASERGVAVVAQPRAAARRYNT